MGKRNPPKKAAVKAAPQNNTTTQDSPTTAAAGSASTASGDEVKQAPPAPPVEPVAEGDQTAGEQVQGTEDSAPLAGTGEAIQLQTPGAEQLPAVTVVQTLEAPDGSTRETLILPTDDAANAPAEDEVEEDADDVELEERMAAYKESYPHETKFFITTDGNVFLSADLQPALEHEKAISGNIDSFFIYRVKPAIS